MNFNRAFAHALIGYEIRRNIWGSEAILYYHDGELRWSKTGRIAPLCGPDPTEDISPEDIRSNDWETI